MKEPDLEEEDLRAEVRDGQLTIARRSLSLDLPEVTVTLPSGEARRLKLSEDAPGRGTATLTAEENGLYRITDGTRTTLDAAGPLNPLALRDPRTTGAVPEPLVDETGAPVRRIAANALPRLRKVAATPHRLRRDGTRPH